MQLIDQRIYPPGETYNDYAIREIDHHEFLKTYNIDDAISIIFSSIEQATDQQGYVLLRTEIYYNGNDVLYHLFDVKFWFVVIQGQQMSLLIPPPLWPIIYAIIIGLIAYILVRSLNLSIDNLQYSPTGPGGETPPWSPLSYAVVLIGAAFLLNALTGLTRQVKR